MHTVRRSMLLALTAGSLLATGGAASAHELEISGSLGAHIYSDGNELGRRDGSPAETAPQHTGLAALRIGYFPIRFFGIEAEGTVVPGVMRASTNEWLVAVGYRGHLVGQIPLMNGRLRPFVLVGGGAHSSVYSTAGAGITQDTDLQVHAGLGLKYNITERLHLRLDGRVLFPPRTQDDSFTQDYEAMIGLGGRFALAAKDTDQDGILDKNDRCPKASEDKDGFEDQDGCPDPDNDRDGVLDGVDACMNEAGPADNRGCPDTDEDGDGIVDRLDQCKGVKGVESERGCPLPDKDQDGVLDKDDQCIDQRGKAALKGCPDTDDDGIADRDDQCPEAAGKAELRGCPDTDGDGILDKDDKCPDKAENKNGYEDADGCPDEIPQALKRFTGVIKGINFKTGKAEILKPSFKLLNEAVAVLKQFPTARMEISGHTDNVGDSAKNRDLSQRRADAVRAYFVEKGGIDAKRLETKGYGPDKPVADNKTKKGQGENRRVEFQLIQ